MELRSPFGTLMSTRSSAMANRMEFFFFQAEDGIRAGHVTGVQTCALPICFGRSPPFPSGGDLPKPYYDIMDPFVVLTAAAAVTQRLRLGTGVCLIAQRDPIQTAKLVASIDQVSGGRFLFGVG